MKNLFDKTTLWFFFVVVVSKKIMKKYPLLMSMLVRDGQVRLLICMGKIHMVFYMYTW